MLLLCVTGLPLIFREEIADWSSARKADPQAEGIALASMDRIVEAALQRRPSEVIRYMFWQPDKHPFATYVSMAPRVDAPPKENNAVIVDSRTAKVLEEPGPNEGFMHVMFKLHVDMFAGLPGMLFLGLMGLFMVVAIVSGVVLYYPFMRRLKFGALRTRQSSRLKWLDWHNLLGIVTAVWLTVVGLTGTINTLNRIIVALWQVGQLAEKSAPFKELPPVENPGKLELSLHAAVSALPNMEVRFVAFPGSTYSSPHHYTFFFQGSTPLTSRLFRPALVDASTGLLTDTREMPWYVKTLFLSQPLHFGDYGGLPLKILWAALDVVAIFVLGSGLSLWLRK